MEKTVYSLCFMCSIRCPIKVTVKDGQVTLIEGNPKVAGIDGSLCPRGSAGISLLYDSQRLQSPMIRTGERGAGQVAQGHLGRSAGLHCRQAEAHHQKARRPQRGPHRADQPLHAREQDLSQGYRLPEPLHSRRLCKGSVNTACRSLFGYTDAQVGIDYKNTKHIVMLAATCSKPCPYGGQQPPGGLAAGAKVTYIDPRVSVTATKASRFWMIRPGPTWR